MTDEREKLVVDNMNLIYWFINKYNLDIDGPEDWFGVCAIGLCNAARKFDISKGIKFSTFAVRCMYNEYLRVVTKKRVQTVQLDDEVWDDLVGDDKDDVMDWEERIEIRDLYKSELQLLSDKKRNIVKDIFEKDMVQREVAEKYGVSRQYVSSVYKNFLKNLKEKYQA